MFDSIYSNAVTPGQFFLMAAASLVSGILFSWLVSFRIRANRRFFILILKDRRNMLPMPVVFTPAFSTLLR